MGKLLKLAVIGVGMVADRHIKNVALDPRAEIKWLCDKSEEVLKLKLAEHGIQYGTTDYSEMLMDKEVDAVIISTPPNIHTRIMKDCMRAGKHILIEKPLCANREELKEIVELVEADNFKDLVILECSCRHARLNPKFKAVKDMIDKGKLGDIYFIHHNYVVRQFRCGIEYNPQAKWFLNKKFAIGGPLVDWGEYDFSFHLGILGDIPKLRSINSFTKNGLDQVEHGGEVFDVEEHGVAFLEFDNGLRYFYERSSNAHNEAASETRIYGTKGGLKLSYPTWDSNEIEYYYVEGDGKGKAASEKLVVDLSNHKGDDIEMITHFIDCILNKTEPMMPVSLAAKHLEIIFEILEKSQTK